MVDVAQPGSEPAFPYDLEHRTRDLERRAQALEHHALEQQAPAERVVIDCGGPRDRQVELDPSGLTWRRMVRWYDPRNLLRSAKESFLSTVIGKYADQRQAVGHPHERPKFFDYREHCARDREGGLWIDYVADAGDGWDSTFTVARGVGAERLAVGGPGKSPEVTELPRASILVLGGDQVYPIASQQEYDERLVAPYAAAIRDLPDDAAHPDVFAIPGNHDWYDSLVAFSRKFLSSRWFAHWRTLQNRSYFALRLPGKWWLLGTDVQLGSDIDGEQLEYFEHIATLMEDGDRVILCNAEPHWIYEALKKRPDPYRHANLKDLESRVLKDRTYLYLAGDLHHYRRHFCEADDRHKITAGGGGAFSHPTHVNLGKLGRLTDQVAGQPSLERERVYQLDEPSCFPPPARSRWIVLRNLLPLGVVWRQPMFLLAPGLLYLLTCWIVMLGLVQQDGRVLGYASALVRIPAFLLTHPGAALWSALIIAGFLVLTPGKGCLRWLAGGLAHWLAHLSAVLLCAWLAAQLVSALGLHGPRGYLLQGLIIFALGGVAGSMVLGWYFTFMCEVLGAHENEVAATQGCRHWKSFLRLRIAPDGVLTIHPIGIARTPRWEPRGYRKDGDVAKPLDGREDHQIYRYIEEPFCIPAAGKGGV